MTSCSSRLGCIDLDSTGQVDFSNLYFPMEDSWIDLHAQVALVNGYRRSAIYDLQRESYLFLRKPLSEWLEKCLPCRKAALYDRVREYYDDADEYVNKLLSEEILFELPQSWIGRFPRISHDLNIPGHLLSATLTFGAVQVYLLELLCGLGLRHLALDVRGKSAKEVDSLRDFVPAELPIQSLTLWWCDTKDGELDEVVRHWKNRLVFSEMHVTLAGTDITDKKGGIDFHSLKGVLFPSLTSMRCNLEHFLVSLQYNVAFYKHVCFDDALNVYEGSSSIYSIGTLPRQRCAATDVAEILSRKTLDNAKKDDTDICSDCEFRHMCTDTRIPVARGNGRWFHETECPYNPYICKWNGEQGYRTLFECGVVSTKDEFTLDHNRIAMMNAEIWGE